MSRSATLSISPARALVDVPRQIRAEGLRPGEIVTLSSQTRRGGGLLWQASVRVTADAQGVIDLQRDAPLPGGSYSGVSPMGLLWAQTPEQPSRELFADTPWQALHTEIRLEREGQPALSAALLQDLAAEGVTRREVREEGLSGTLFLPPGPGPHPVVMVLNGSGGGINEPRAALYASRGYAALALGYFKAPGRSPYISNTPLEYFESALQWLHRTVQPAEGFVALSGQSRGGELVLLLGSMFPHLVSAVIGYVPGAVVHSAQNACDPATGREGPAWLYKGQALPHVWEGNAHATWAPWDHGPEPRRHTDAILTALRDEAAVERARIRVERIAGPVLVISAGDDGSWPSTLYGQMVLQRLQQFAHPHAAEQLDYPEAGHLILFPYMPTTQLVYAHPVSGRLSTSGGTSAANAQADEASWPGVLRFLAAARQARTAGHTAA